MSPSATLHPGETAYYVGMATWMDGPEYAPPTRPSAFTDPGLPPLEIVPPAPPPPGAPGDQPAYMPPAQPQADLATLVPPQPPARDPRAPFDVITMTLTNAGPSGEEWTPTQPLGSPTSGGPIDVGRRPAVAPLAQINAPSFPAPGTSQWFAPGEPPPPRPVSISLKDVGRAVTPPVLVFGALAGLINPMALPMLTIALVATSRIAYRRRAVTTTVGLVSGLLGLVAFTEFYSGDDLLGLYAALCDVSQVVSWAVLVTLVIVMYRALSLRERPERW